MKTLEQSPFSPPRRVEVLSRAAPQDAPAGFKAAYYAYHLGQHVQHHHSRSLTWYLYEGFPNRFWRDFWSL